MISDIAHNLSCDAEYFLHRTALNVTAHQPLQLAYINLLICEQGSATFSINFAQYQLHQGEILFVADDAIVMLLSRSSDFIASGIFLKRHFAAEVAFELPNPLFSFLHHHPILKPNDETQSLLDFWTHQIWFIFQSTHKYQRIILRNHLQNLFLVIVNLIPENAHQQTPKQSRQEKLCWQFWDLIGKYATQERSVKFYAAKLAITPYYLAKISQEILNDAPKTLIDRQVTLEIKRLLTNQSLTMEQIADQLKFPDPSYLSRYFKKQTQMTLTQFRQKS